MAKPLMLWFDCTSNDSSKELREVCAKHFDTHCSTRLGSALQDIQRLRPKVLCFEFDFPDQTQLRAMQRVKREYMGLPILMLTVEHSEALAVWAFRARVWNYLVKPVRPREYIENLRTLAQIAGAERRLGRPVARPEPGMPHELALRPPENAEAALLPAVNYVEQHFNERCSAKEVAKLCGMSRFHFSRAFRSTFGVTFRDHLLRYRVNEACRLLQRPNVSVTEVGYAVGFNDASHFARMFKRFTSMLPSEYTKAAPNTPASGRPRLIASSLLRTSDGPQPA